MPLADRIRTPRVGNCRTPRVEIWQTGLGRSDLAKFGFLELKQKQDALSWLLADGIRTPDVGAVAWMTGLGHLELA